jgi:hypothetical protein
MSQQSIHDRIMSRQRGHSPELIEAGSSHGHGRKWLKVVVPSILGIVALSGLGYAALNYAPIQRAVLKMAAAETNDAKPALTDTPFLQHAKQAGVQACSSVFPVLGELLTNGAKYDVQSSWNREAPDSHAVQALVGMNYSTGDYSGPAAGVVFASPTKSACEGTMIRVAPFSASCANMSSNLPQGSRLANNLGQISVYDLGGGKGNALLLPAGNSCVVISVATASG